MPVCGVQRGGWVRRLFVKAGQGSKGARVLGQAARLSKGWLSCLPVLPLHVCVRRSGVVLGKVCVS